MLVDDSDRMVFRSSIDVTGPANTALSDGTKDARLIAPATELLIGYKIWPVDSMDGPGSTELEAVDAGGGEDFVERPRHDVV